MSVLGHRFGADRAANFGRDAGARRYWRVVALVVAVAIAGGLPEAARAAAPPRLPEIATTRLPALKSDPLSIKRPNEPVVDLTAPGMPRPRRQSKFDPKVSTVVATTETSRTYRNIDGTLTTRVAAGQKWFKDGLGVWQEIDLDLLKLADGRLAPKSSPLKVVLGARGDQALAELPLGDGHSVALFLDGMSAEAESKSVSTSGGPAARFESGGPAGIRVETAPLVRGFKSTYTLSSLDQGSQAITETLALPPTWRAAQSGASIEILNETGDTVARWGDGLAFNSAATSSRVPVTSRLTASDAGRIAITESVDEAWLRDPRAFFRSSSIRS